MAIKNSCITSSMLVVLSITKTVCAANLINSEHLEIKDGQASSSHLNDKSECQVHQTYKPETCWPEKPLQFLAFIEYKEPISYSITFQEQNTDFVYDRLIVSHDGITIYKIRNGHVKESVVSKFLDTAGWTWVEVSMEKDQFVLKHWNITALNYTVDHPVSKLTVHGSNITVCKEKSPTWILEHEISARIPLEPSRLVVNPFIKRTHLLTLRSDGDFNPCIFIDGNKKCLALEDSKIALSTTSEFSPLPAGIFLLYLELMTGHINIYHENEGKRQDIVNFPMNSMRYIEMTSNMSKFSASLIFFQQSNVSIADRDDSLRNEPYNDITSNKDKVSPREIGLIVAIALLGSALAVLAIIFICVILRLRCSPYRLELKKNIQQKNVPNSSDSSVNEVLITLTGKSLTSATKQLLA